VGIASTLGRSASALPGSGDPNFDGVSPMRKPAAAQPYTAAEKKEQAQGLAGV
jgi:hypothetical protein